MQQLNIEQKLDKLLSTLSNEANLYNVEYAWLVFGVEDKKHKIVGTNYRLDEKSLNNLKEEIAKQTKSAIKKARELYKVRHSSKADEVDSTQKIAQRTFESIKENPYAAIQKVIGK